MKAAPALAAVNVIISKASEANPFSSLFLGELVIQAGIPQVFPTSFLEQSSVVQPLLITLKSGR
jgi:acyl-CoA reductase-like NAD-dependent aldehyde dehydrogenase